MNGDRLEFHKFTSPYYTNDSQDHNKFTTHQELWSCSVYLIK